MKDTTKIEEMAITIAKARDYPCRGSCSTCDARILFCSAYEIAVALVNEGYKKQSEGEWTWEHDLIRDPKRYFIRVVCSCCGLKTGETSNYCPKCGAKMKGGE